MTQENPIKFDFTNPSDPKNAQFCFTFASLAYKSQPEVEEELRKIGYDDTKAIFFKSSLTAGFIVERDDVIAVSFRGSSTWREWLNNCNMWLRRTEDGRVHSGFWTTVERISPSIFEMILPRLRPGIKLVVTGHSRGGALAPLFRFMFDRHVSRHKLSDYPVVVLTFGSPKFCDGEFVASMKGDTSKEQPPKTPFHKFLQFMYDFAINVYGFIAMFIWLLHFVFVRRMAGIDHHFLSSYEKSIRNSVVWAPFVRRMKAMANGKNLSSDEEEAIRSKLNGTKVTFITKEKLQVDLQPWEQWRLVLRKTVQGVLDGDPIALKEYDAVLTEFEARPFSRTPLENLEILSVYYVPKDGFEKCLFAVILNAVLGWYDVLRFASSSGRAEIIDNEGFFNMAFTLGGKDSEADNFLRNNPDKIAESLVQAFSFAEKLREISDYDRHWPSAYGLEGIISALDGSCKEIPALPKNQWDIAWEEVKQTISAYYQLSKPSTSIDVSH